MQRQVSVLLLVLLSLLTCCKSSTEARQRPAAADTPKVASPAALTRLNVGYLPLSPALPLFVAQEHGLFKAAQLEVELRKYQNGALLAEDVIADRIAAASPGPVDVYLTKNLESAGRFAIYLQSAYSPENYIYSLLVTKKSGIRDSSQLKGKRIAVFPGVTNSLVLRLMLKKRHHWNDEQFTVLGVAPPLQLPGLEAGEFDALCPLEPTGTVGASRDGLRMIETGPIEREVLNPLYITAHALSLAAAKRDPDALHRFVGAMELAVDAIRADPKGARALLTKYTPLTDAQAQSTPLGEFRKVSEADVAKFQQLADLLTKEDVLAKPIDVSALYYRRNAASSQH